MRVRGFCSEFWEWVKENKIDGRFSSIKPFNFTLGALRETGINIFHIENGLDITATRDSVSHKHLQTTEGYLQHETVRASNQTQIRDGMEFMVDWITKYKPAVIEPEAEAVAASIGLDASQISLLQGQKLIDREYGDIGHGISCTDRENSPWPLGRKGQSCEFFSGCFACPKNIVIATALNFARIYLFRQHIDRSAEAIIRKTPLRWQKIYEPQLDVLASVLEDFPPNVALEGRELAVELDIPFPPLR